jgi:hypothetical protein
MIFTTRTVLYPKRENRAAALCGRVVSHQVRVGQLVRKGDAILRIQSQDLIEAQIAYRAACESKNRRAREWSQGLMEAQFRISSAITEVIRRTGKIPDDVPIPAERDGIVAGLLPVGELFDECQILFEIDLPDRLMARIEVPSITAKQFTHPLRVSVKGDNEGERAGAIVAVDRSTDPTICWAEVHFDQTRPGIGCGSIVTVSVYSEPPVEVSTVLSPAYFRGVAYRKAVSKENRGNPGTKTSPQPQKGASTTFPQTRSSGVPDLVDSCRLKTAAVMDVMAFSRGGAAMSEEAKSAAASPSVTLDLEAEKAVAGAVFALPAVEKYLVRERAVNLLIRRTGCLRGEALKRVEKTMVEMWRERKALVFDAPTSRLRIAGSGFLPEHKLEISKRWAARL